MNHATNIEPETGLTIVTEEGDTMPTAKVELTLTKQGPETGNIAASVTDSEGNPVAEASVTIEGPVSDSTVGDSSGNAEFTDVPLGDYTVAASKSGYNGDNASITSGDFS
jgi:Bacterial Ig-like domain (group 1).